MSNTLTYVTEAKINIDLNARTMIQLYNMKNYDGILEYATHYIVNSYDLENLSYAIYDGEDDLFIYPCVLSLIEGIFETDNEVSAKYMIDTYMSLIKILYKLYIGTDIGIIDRENISHLHDYISMNASIFIDLITDINNIKNGYEVIVVACEDEFEFNTNIRFMNSASEGGSMCLFERAFIGHNYEDCRRKLLLKLGVI